MKKEKKGNTDIMKENILEKRYNLLLGLLTAVAAVMYLLLCQGDLVWMDEAYTFGMIRRSYSEMCSITALDVHPPLYYIMLKAFATPFTNKLLAGKIFAVIPYVIIMIFGGIQLKKLFNAKTGLSFGVLFFFFPFMLSYAAEVRMYSWAALFVFINAVYAYRAYLYNTKKDWILYTIFGLSAAYTHYFAVASAAVIYGWLLLCAIIKKRELVKPWLITAAVTVILYLPWLRFFVEQLKYKIDNEYWIEPITLKTFKTYFTDIFSAESNMAMALVIALASAVMLFFGIKSRKDRTISLIGISVPVLTLVLGMAASFIIRPVFVIRYLLPSVPLFIVSMAIGTANINKKVPTLILTGIIVVVGIVSYSTAYYDRNTHFDGRMDDAFYERNRDCDAYIVTIDRNDIHPGHTETVLAYYETEKDIYQVVENYGYYPFENFRYIGDFDSDKYERVIILVASGKEIPKEYRDDYTYEYRETTTSLWIPADVYIMTRK